MSMWLLSDVPLFSIHKSIMCSLLYWSVYWLCGFFHCLPVLFYFWQYVTLVIILWWPTLSASLSSSASITAVRWKPVNVRLIFGMSIGVNPSYKRTKGIFDWSHCWEENEHCIKLSNVNKLAVNKLVLTYNVSMGTGNIAQVQGHTRHIVDHLWMASSLFYVCSLHDFIEWK